MFSENAVRVTHRRASIQRGARGLGAPSQNTLGSFASASVRGYGLSVLPFEDRPYAAERLNQIVATARERNPFYRSWIPDPSRVPLLDRTTFSVHNDEILNGNPVTSRTSGSTGTPVRISVSPELAQARMQDIQRFVSWLGGPLPAAKLIYAKDRVPSDVCPVTSPVDEQIDFIVQRHREAGATAVTTLPTNALILCDRIRERGVDTRFVTRFGLFGEAVEQSHRNAIATTFPNAKLWSTYSSEEFGLIGAECPHSPGHHHLMAHRLGIEFLHPARDEPAAAGETARLVITDFLNTQSPLIRYEIGDLALVETCPCGRIDLPSCGAILGKTRGFLRHRNGARVPFVELSTLLRDIPGMRRYQVHQSSLEEFEIRVVADRRVDLEVGAALQAHFGYLPERVTVTYLDELPQGPRGKFHHAICDC